MTTSSSNQFNLCETCGKPVTPGHTHEGQTPEEIAASAGTGRPIPICEVCGEVGTYAEHKANKQHVCAICTEPGITQEHIAKGIHPDVCPTCMKKWTPGHNHLTDRDADKKKYAKVTASTPVQGITISDQYDIIGKMVAGFQGGQEIMDQTLSVPSRKNRKTKSTPDPIMRFDGSGASSASEYAGQKLAEFTHPADPVFFQAKLVLKDASGRPTAPVTYGREGEQGGITGFHIHDITPDTQTTHTVTFNGNPGKKVNVNDLLTSTFSHVEESTHPKTGEAMLTLHHVGGRKSVVRKSDVTVNSQTVPGIYVGSLAKFIPDSEIHNLSYVSHPQAPRLLSGPTDKDTWWNSVGLPTQQKITKETSRIKRLRARLSKREKGWGEPLYRM